MKKLIILISLLTSVVFTTRAQKNTFSCEFGDRTLTMLSEGQRQSDVSKLMGASSKILELYAPDGKFATATNIFVVTRKGKHILIDAGTSAEKTVANLALLKITPDDIPVILLTHMHGDHIGGLIKDGKAVFPKAQLYIPQSEYDYWITEQNSQLQVDVTKAYADRLTLFVPTNFGDQDPPQVVSGVRAIAAPGHTPGHTVYRIKAGEQQAMIWGDVTYAIGVQVANPKVATIYDIDPETAIATRRRILGYVAKYDIVIAGMHIPYPGMGKISRNEEGQYSYAPLSQ